MTPMPAREFSDATTAACLFFIFLVPLAAAGISMMNAGLGRSRSATHMMLASLLAFSVAALAYFVCGFAWQGFIGGSNHAIVFSGRPWNWIAGQKFLFSRLGRDGSVASLTALFQMFCVGLAALIPLGSGADRWRLRAICASTAVLAGWTYPVFAHWVWGGGWLAQLGVNYGLGQGFVDAGGSSAIHVVGGLTALAIAWIVGPRFGKYSADGMAPAIPGHNGVLVMFGCLLSLIGWLGLNSAGAMLFTGSTISQTSTVALNTILGAAAAAATAAIITGIRFGKPDASLIANGWVGGLVASSATCVFVVPAQAVVIGSIAGALIIFSIQWIELKLEIDDPSGAISVHGIGGIWGLLAVGLLVDFDAPVLNVVRASAPTIGANSAGQWIAQLAGLATLLGFVLPLTYGLNWLLNRIYPFRVSIEGEQQGMDLHELGAGAYPEFVTHTEDFLPH